MKYFLILVIFPICNSYADDCGKIIQEMEAFNTKIQSALSSVTSAEKASLNNIFNKNIRGPGVVSIAKNSKDELLNVVLPNRKKVDDAVVSGLSYYITQLKNCKNKISDCTGTIKNNPRNTIKDLSEAADQANSEITSKTLPK